MIDVSNYSLLGNWDLEFTKYFFTVYTSKNKKTILAEVGNYQSIIILSSKSKPNESGTSEK
jgi:hypothetical protein